MVYKSAAALEMADFIKLSPTKMGSWFKLASVKQPLWTLREAGAKKGRRATGGPLTLQGDVQLSDERLHQHF